jgi:transcriptional regulator with XRE-family HTH domain
MSGDPALGLAVRRLRHRRHVQHTALADATDVSPATLLAVESGLVGIDWARVRRIQAALGVELVEFMEAVQRAER